MIAGDRRVRRALLWERYVHLSAHPVAYPLAVGLSRLSPVAHVPRVGYLVRDAAVARAVLVDTENFSKNGPGSAGELITQVMGDYALLNLEGDAHHELRALLAPLLSASALHDLVGTVWGAGLSAAVDALRASRRVDLVRLATILTGQTMRLLLGMGRADDEAACIAAFNLGEQMVRVVRLRAGPLTPSDVVRARERYRALTDGIAAAIPHAPSDSVTGRLRDAGCDERQIRGVGSALLLTGTGTVSTALPRTAALLSDAGMWDRMPERKARLDVVDESLRIICPSPVMLRSVEHEVTISGHRFERGRRVAVLTYAAVRDFEGGNTFQPGRAVPAAARGLYFGAGIHHCIGYGLARAELELSLDRLSEVAPLRVHRRAAAVRVLIPRYRLLEVEGAA